MRLVLIDDHPLVLQGVMAIIEPLEDLEVVGTAASCTEGVKVIEELQPDVAVVDLKLPGECGLELVRKARALVPACKFAILTSSAEMVDIRQAMVEKVDGYILKEALPEEIIAALRLVGKGRTYIEPVLIQMLIGAQEDNPIGQLTPREMEVLNALGQGMCNRDIARVLFITEYTVKKHVSQILDKLNLADRTQAALYARSNGLGASM